MLNIKNLYNLLTTFTGCKFFIRFSFPLLFVTKVHTLVGYLKCCFVIRRITSKAKNIQFRTILDMPGSYKWAKKLNLIPEIKSILRKCRYLGVYVGVFSFPRRTYIELTWESRQNKNIRCFSHARLHLKIFKENIRK